MSSAFDPGLCPVCQVQQATQKQTEDFEFVRLSCGNCGSHRFRQATIDDLPGMLRTGLDRAKVAHGIRQRPDDDLITTEEVTQMQEVIVLPDALERVNRLVRYMAEQEPGSLVSVSVKALRAWLGCASAEAAKWVVDQASALGYLEDRPMAGYQVMTSDGWARYAELMKTGAGSRKAFMAMAFTDEMKALVDNHFRKAVSATGFELLTTLHSAQAGNIIARMKVEIHTSRFVVCDLSDSNQGAYWEAGFAEGLQRPVIYTCRASAMTDPDPKKRPHFDTAQQHIIKWDPSDLAPALQELKNVIRATLPAEAKMTDD